jgi:ABC-2 type transport system permease protein
MRSALSLVAHSLTRVRGLVVGVGLLLAGFQVLLTLVGATVHRMDAFRGLVALIPPAARDLMGPAMLAMMSFGGIVCIGYFHPVVIAALVGMVITVAAEPAAEIEMGFVDLMLSRPLARYAVVTRTLVLLVLCSAFVVGLMVVGTWAGLYLFAPPGAIWPEPRLVFSLALNLGALVMCWGGVGLAIAVGSNRRSVAGSLAGGLALGCFLLDYVARIWKPAQIVWWLSPFRYDNAIDLVLGRPLPLGHLAVLASVGLASGALSYVVFSRRDL